MKVFSIKRIVAAAIAFSLTLFIVSCKKDNAEKTSMTQSEATEYSAESMEAEASYDDIQDISMTAADEEGVASAGRGEGAKPFPFLKLKLRIGVNAVITVSPDDQTYPKTVTIDFGNGQNCPDGKFRKGKIVVNLSKRIRETGATATITLVDYQIGRAKVEGTKVITNLSANGVVKFSVKVTDGKVTYPSGRGYSYEALRYITQTAGATTDEVIDDVYTIEGHSQTSFNAGLVITLDSVTPLVKKVACPWISSGVLKIKVNTYEFSLDYAHPNNGDCDNQALLSYNGQTKLVTLP